MRTKYIRKSENGEVNGGLYGYYGRFVIFESRCCGVSSLNLQAHYSGCRVGAWSACSGHYHKAISSCSPRP